MKTIAAALAIAASLFAQEAKEPQYEMTTYVLGLLYRGPNAGTGTPEEAAKLQEGHMANIGAMAKAGKLTVAGPIGDKGELRGIFIFHNTTMDEAKALVAADPAIKAGRLRIELHPWFAAKGIKPDPPK